MKRNFEEEKANAAEFIAKKRDLFRDMCICEHIVNGYYDKKMEMLDEVTTLEQLDDLKNPHAPVYNGNGWTISPYMPLEEEAICWSETSLIAPLSDVAVKRYLRYCFRDL